MLNFDKSIAILGSTGSVGKQSVEIAEFHKMKVDLLTASSSVDEMERQARLLSPKTCVLSDSSAANDLRVRLADTSTKVYGGEKSAISAKLFRAQA